MVVKGQVGLAQGAVRARFRNIRGRGKTIKNASGVSSSLIIHYLNIISSLSFYISVALDMESKTVIAQGVSLRTTVDPSGIHHIVCDKYSTRINLSRNAHPQSMIIHRSA